MASVTNMKFPDGRVESKNIVTSFEKNGTSVIVFETDKVDNGHKVVGVSYLSDGMYQNIVDQNKWSEVKNYLVDILHDRISVDDYRIVPEEVLVTVDPYHPLGLRDENLDKLNAGYEAFKVTKEIVAPVNEPVSVEPVMSDVVSVEPMVSDVVSTETPDVVSASIEPAAISNGVISEPVVEEPVINGTIMDQPIDAPVLGDVPEVAPVSVEPVIVDQPVSEPALAESAEQLNTSVDPIVVDQNEVEPVLVNDSLVGENSQVINENPILDPFAIADSLGQIETPAENVVHEDIVPPVGVDIVNNSPEAEIPNLDVATDPVVVDPVVINMPVNEPALVEQPVIDSVSATQPEMIVEPEVVVQENDSAVKDAYLSGANSLIQKMRDTSSMYLNEMTALQEKYIKEMEDIRAEISRNLEEAKGINELSKQTFDKAQSMTEGSVLELTRVA